jgi:hypothetical protein
MHFATQMSQNEKLAAKFRVRSFHVFNSITLSILNIHLEVPWHVSNYIPPFYSYSAAIIYSTFLINQPCIELEQESATQ